MLRLLIFMCTPEKITLSFLLSLTFSLLFPLAAGAATYTVKAGDTLYDLSLRYGTSVRLIQKANGITGHLIYPGQQIIIPEKGQADKDTENRNSKEYTVLKGDCLYTIARRYGTTVTALMQANHVSSTLIFPGQTLFIPVPAPGGANRPGPATSSSRGITSPSAKTLLSYAASFLGRGYAYGGSGPDVFDCSGFVRYVFRTAGFDLPHNAAAQAGLGTPVDRSSLRPGDLVFFSYYGSGKIDHVGIYAGNDSFIHASSRGGVKYSSLTKSYYQQNYQGARRLLDR